MCSMSSYYEKILATGEVKCIDEEIPFEIPKGWEWTRIGNIFNHASGKQQSSSNKGGGTPQKFITTSNLYWGYFFLDNVKIMNFTDEEIKTCSATKGDLLVCEGGAGYGRSAIWNEAYDICLQNHVHRLRPCISGICEYVYHFIYLLKESNNLASVGTAMPGLSASRLKGLLLPFPPLLEQKRIVAELEELLPWIDKYSRVQSYLDELNTTIKNSLKKSILQEAIQGKLVPQIDSEGTAQELLQQIKAEKQILVKENKLKKSALNDSVIFRGDDNKYYTINKKEKICIDDEIPFDIPGTWEWCCLGTLFSHCTGKALNASNLKGSLMTYITTSNLYWNRFELDNLKQMRFTDEEIEKCTATFGDLLVCEGGDIGRAAIWNYPYDIRIQNHIHKLRAYKQLCTKFFFWVFYFYKATRRIGGKGIGIQGLSSKALDNILIPLPPLKEQQRIVAQIEKLFEQLH